MKNNNQINLSIIIPTWNTAEVTKKCIQTINKFLNPDLTVQASVFIKLTDQQIFDKIKND